MKKYFQYPLESDRLIVGWSEPFDAPLNDFDAIWTEKVILWQKVLKLNKSWEGLEI